MHTDYQTLKEVREIIARLNRIFRSAALIVQIRIAASVNEQDVVAL